MYVAPEIPGRDLVRAVFDVQGVPFEVTTEVLVYRQFVILKADLSFFEAQYRSHPEEESLVLQVHPNAIDSVHLPELERILSLLVAEGCTFVTAEEYHHLQASRGSGASRVAARAVAGGP
ncbi:MAG: hypothetical protein WDA75_06230 [Candidatus Latescibacterota bacterium]